MKRFLTLFFALAIVLPSKAQKTTEQATAIGALVDGATDLLGPVGTLVDLGIELIPDLSNKRRQIDSLEKMVQRRNDEISELKTKVNLFVDDFNDYKDVVKATNDEYMEEIKILKDLAIMTQNLRKSVTVIETFKDGNANKLYESTGDYNLIWFRVYYTKLHVNRILTDVNTALTVDKARLDKLDAALASQLVQLFSNLSTIATDLKNTTLQGQVPDFPNALTAAQQAQLSALNSNISIASNTGGHGINTLAGAVDAINSSLLGYLTVYVSALHNVNQKLSGVNLVSQ